MPKEAEAEHHEVSAAMYTTSVAATRATFLAGFSYYQIGRYNFTPGYDSAYVVFNTAAFTFAVISAAYSALTGYYLGSSMSSSSKLELLRRSMAGYSRGAFLFFIIALICYTLGLSRLGYVYYPLSQQKYQPFAIMIAATLINIYSYYYVVLKFAALGFNDDIPVAMRAELDKLVAKYDKEGG